MALTIIVVLVVLGVVAVVAVLAGQGRRYRREQQRIIEAAISDQPAHTDDLPLAADRPGGGWHGPSCSGGFPAVTPASDPAVPTQRTGDHDDDLHEPGRARAGRLLRRRGSPEPG